jgi:hypothetical protein
MREWVMVLHAADRDHLGAVRILGGLLAAELEGHLWLRGIPFDSKMPMEVRKLPAHTTWELNETGELRQTGALTPSARLPEMEWKPLPEFLPVEPPTSALPGLPKGYFNVQLAPSDTEQKAEVLRISIDALKTYCETAPEARLQKLHYAVANDGECLVMGEPLLPLPGRTYWRRGPLLLPAGFDFDPPTIGGLVEQEMAVGKPASYLFEVNGTWECIPSECWQKLSRIGVRSLEGGTL